MAALHVMVFPVVSDICAVTVGAGWRRQIAQHIKGEEGATVPRESDESDDQGRTHVAASAGPACGLRDRSEGCHRASGRVGLGANNRVIATAHVHTAPRRRRGSLSVGSGQDVVHEYVLQACAFSSVWYTV